MWCLVLGAGTRGGSPLIRLAMQASQSTFSLQGRRFFRVVVVLFFEGAVHAADYGFQAGHDDVFIDAYDYGDSALYY